MKLERKTPKITVIMPSYNSEKYLDDSIQSILNQTFTDFEFIIIDDSSTDNSWKIIQEYAKKDNRIISIKNDRNLWITKTLNMWIKFSKWEYIAIMHSDDIAKISRFEEQFNFLKKNTDIDLIWSFVEYIDAFNNIIYKIKTKPTDMEIIKKDIWKYSPVVSPTFFFRKSLIDSVWFFDENLNRCEDFDFLVRCLINWKKISNVGKVLLSYRITKNQLSWNQKKEMLVFLEIYRKYKKYFNIDYKIKIIISIKVIVWILFPKKVSTFLEHLYKKFKKYE